jgi:hypothetical protein
LSENEAKMSENERHFSKKNTKKAIFWLKNAGKRLKKRSTNPSPDEISFAKCPKFVNRFFGKPENRDSKSENRKKRGERKQKNHFRLKIVIFLRGIF